MLKIIILGDCGVGKTSLVNYFVSNAPKHTNNSATVTSDDGSIFEPSYQPTIGIRFISCNVGSESVQLWDCSGHNSFQSLRDSHFKEAHGAVVVYDVNKRSSFESALSMILDHKKASRIDHVGSKMPIILVGTKTDLSTSSESPRKSEQYVSKSEQRNRAERYNVTLNARTSSKTEDGVMDMFESIILAVKVAVTKKCAEKWKSNQYNERIGHNDDNCGMNKGLAVGIGGFSSIWACFADCSTLDSNEAGEGVHNELHHDQSQGRAQQGRNERAYDGGAGLGTSWDKVPHLEVTSMSSESGSSPKNNPSNSQKIGYAQAVYQGQSQSKGQTSNNLILNRASNYENCYDDHFNTSNQESNYSRNKYAKIGI